MGNIVDRGGNVTARHDWRFSFADKRYDVCNNQTEMNLMTTGPGIAGRDARAARTRNPRFFLNEGNAFGLA
jgi:hypothetical protein